jgi:ArsR family transcriptional regulator
MTDAVAVSQPTVSHHLKVLTEAGVLIRERRGTWAWFRLESARLEEIRGFLA